jgi:hypothetical protein
MKRIANLNVRNICTQGIVREDGSIHISTASYLSGAFQPTTVVGYNPGIDFSFQSVC